MAKKQNKAEGDISLSDAKKPKARKMTKRVEKQQNSEDILFECRNKLRGNANMTTKRDMLLTLVFLRLICSRFNEQKEKVKSDVLVSLCKTEDGLSAAERDFVTMMQENKSSFEQDGVFYLQDGYNWEKLVTLPASERAIALDNGITQHPDLRANYIMANPPFNLKAWRTEKQLTKDIRWSGYGLPPVSNANYAWILHMLYHLDSANGIAGFLFPIYSVGTL